MIVVSTSKDNTVAWKAHSFGESHMKDLETLSITPYGSAKR